jgi:hypothetical protein
MAITRMAGEEGTMGKRLGILGAVIAVVALVVGAFSPHTPLRRRVGPRGSTACPSVSRGNHDYRAGCMQDGGMTYRTQHELPEAASSPRSHDQQVGVG